MTPYLPRLINSVHRSLVPLEVLAQSHAALRPILLRRRRALANLRAAARERHVGSPLASVPLATPVTLGQLADSEMALVQMYDHALQIITSVDARLLSDQRAEAAEGSLVADTLARRHGRDAG